MWMRRSGADWIVWCGPGGVVQFREGWRETESWELTRRDRPDNCGGAVQIGTGRSSGLGDSQ